MPEAGDRFMVMADEKSVREIAQRRQQLKREQNFRRERIVERGRISNFRRFDQLIFRQPCDPFAPLFFESFTGSARLKAHLEISVWDVAEQNPAARRQ